MPGAPYRLNLPPDFTWVEADLPELLAEKAQLLADEQPRCRLTRSAVDLANPRARDAFLNDALKREEIGWWMLDFAGPGLKKMMNKKMAGMVFMRAVAWLPQPDPRRPGGRPWSAVAVLVH